MKTSLFVSQFNGLAKEKSFEFDVRDPHVLATWVNKFYKLIGFEKRKLPFPSHGKRFCGGRERVLCGSILIL